MGMLETPAEMPDVYGIPEYRCTEMQLEIAGKDVRMAFGDKRFGQTNWLYTTVVPPDDLISFCHEAEAFAHQLKSLVQLLEHRRGH